MVRTHLKASSTPPFEADREPLSFKKVPKKKPETPTTDGSGSDETMASASKAEPPPKDIAMPDNFEPLVCRNSSYESVMKGKIDPWISLDFDEGRPIKSLKELQIMKVINEIRNKPDWTRKCQDETIVSKWREETKGFLGEETMMDWVVEECRYYAKKATDSCRISPVEGVFEIDNVVEEELKTRLKNGLKALEDDNEPDWHPGSDGMVLDLIHPALFPMVYGTTRVFNDSIVDKLEIDPMNVGSMMSQFEHALIADPPPGCSKKERNAHDQCLSKKFQWLPSEVSVFREGCVFTSYINNLHPELHKNLTIDLGKLFDKFIPLFNEALTEACMPPVIRWYPDMSQDSLYPDMPSHNDDAWDDWYDNRTATVPAFDSVFDGDNGTCTIAKQHGYYEPDGRRTCIPETLIDLRPAPGQEERKLQVIVKAANIHLTPEKPNYKGGVWHVEGTPNESIVATGLYYYDNENITESKLNVRIGVREPDYEQCDNPGVLGVFGFNDEDDLTQNLGGITAIEDRLVVFPNYLQHCVQPFELADKTKSGHRKIIAFFLIDPTKTRVSTRHVIPQQAEWWNCERLGVQTNAAAASVMDFLGFPLSLTQAKTYREELMEERGAFTIDVNEEHFAREFSLCEH